MKARKNALWLIVVVLVLMFTSCVQAVSEEKILIIKNDKHENITWDLIELVENDEELKELLEKSIQKAKVLNPDTDTNPVVDLESICLQHRLFCDKQQLQSHRRFQGGLS